MEGIPDHHEPQVFTGRRSRWSWQLSHAPKDAGEGRAHRERKRGKRQGCQRLGRSRAPWDENAHARRRSRPTTCEARGQGHTTAMQRMLCPRRSAEAIRTPWKRSVPRSSRSEPKLREAPTRRKPRQCSRERTRCECTQFVRVAEVDRTHRASCPPGGRKSSWWETRQGASQKEARSPSDAGHEQVEGETVRG